MVSNSVVIRIENLSKEYRLGTISHGTLQRDLQSWWARIRGREDPNSIIGIEQSERSIAHRAKRNAPNAMQENPHFLALDDVSFEVHQGEVLGIIGRNGAGKSTLLKILSKVTAPTRGIVKIKGRIASLLEVGTGFHPELTGRENVHLNGAILGMTKKEIASKFDEIVAFSEIEQFIDTPVKRYSSGMYVRLAFAVAAHLEPEILIVDEVLAVGDAAFQKKCLGKMGDVAKEGRTVLFVSHNMDAVLRLCKAALLLNRGTIQAEGSTEDVINVYLKENVGSSATKRWDFSKAPGDEIVKLLEVYVHDENREVKDNYDISKPLGITMKYEVLKGGYVLSPAFNFFNNYGLNIFDSHDTTPDRRNIPKQPGVYVSTVWLPGNLLSEGIVIVGAAMVTPGPFIVHFQEKDIVAFTIIDTFQQISARGEYVGSFPGVIRPLLKWDIGLEANARGAGNGR